MCEIRTYARLHGQSDGERGHFTSVMLKLDVWGCLYELETGWCMEKEETSTAESQAPTAGEDGGTELT